MTKPDIPAQLIPKHIALVMDGNGRWAKERGLPRTAGHSAGTSVLMDVVDGCLELGVPYLSAYAFSTENWRRSHEEVRSLMGYSRSFLREQRDILHSKNVRVVWVGRRPRLWRSVIKELQNAEELTKNNTAMTFAMCLNYGGRAEIVDATRKIAAQVAAGQLRPDQITPATIQGALYDPEMPDVDLFLRPSGEKRTSNFLMWQSAYAEMVYQDVLFPDFTVDNLYDAVVEYARRDRRFGKEESSK